MLQCYFFAVPGDVSGDVSEDEGLFPIFDEATSPECNQVSADINGNFILINFLKFLILKII